MVASPLKHLPPVAAATVATRISHSSLAINWHDAKPSGPDRRPYSLQVCCCVTLSYETRKVGAGRQAQVQREEGPHVCLGARQPLEPAQLQSHDACRDAVHKVLTEMPLLREFDLAPANWRWYLPHDVATAIVDLVARDDRDESGAARGYVFAVHMSIRVRIIYSEPKALLLACKEAAAENPDYCTTQCTICLEELAKEDTDGVVSLSCSHAFHSRCIAPWFYKATTCPLCRHNMMNHLSAINPTGTFPELSP